MNEEQVVPLDKVREAVDIALAMKVEELHYFGYDRATKDDVWECLINYTWKKVKEEQHMYQLINDVLSLSATDYMNYLTLHKNHESPENFFKQFEMTEDEV